MQKCISSIPEINAKELLLVGTQKISLSAWNTSLNKTCSWKDFRLVYLSPAEGQRGTLPIALHWQVWDVQSGLPSYIVGGELLKSV